MSLWPVFAHFNAPNIIYHAAVSLFAPKEMEAVFIWPRIVERALLKTFLGSVIPR
jgi:hypothetical protein